MSIRFNLLIYCIAIALIPSIAIAATCGSHQVLFQSNAYADSLADGDSKFEGGSVQTSQYEWDEFLTTFHPNIEGESIARTDIDFNEEKVVIGTYGTSATCMVEIDDVRLQCESVDGATSVKLEMDVIDSSLGCQIKCMALGQVVYAVAVPVEWEIDTNDIVVKATGPCLEETTTSSTEEVYQKLELIQYSLELDNCDSGECLSPNGTCAEEVLCFVDPCKPDLGACEADEICTSNYCGGCSAVCTPVDNTTTSGPTSTVASQTTTTYSTTGSVEANDDLIDAIVLDTTTSSTQGVEVAVTTGATDPNKIVSPPSVPTDDELCNQITVAYESSALARYLVLDGMSGSSVTIITSQDQMDELLAGFMPMTQDASISELEGVEFTTSQVIFATHYESNTCNIEIMTSNFVCDGTTIKLGMDLLDESAGCEVSCDAEGQVVYAIVTPIGAEAELDTTTNGPCLDAITIDSVTVATEAASTTDTASSVASTTTASTEDSDSNTNSVPQTTKPDSGNVPEGIPRNGYLSNTSGPMPSLVLGGIFLVFHLL
ncbi:hypothetical protein ACHAXN_011301 [Cyclotella atomus]|jgi:hypothetical protein